MTNSREPNSARGNVRDRRRRKLFLLSPESGWGGNGTEVPCSEPKCPQIVTIETIFVDRIIPGAEGGRYTRDNIKPHCCRCSHQQGWLIRKGKRCSASTALPKV